MSTDSSVGPPTSSPAWDIVLPRSGRAASARSTQTDTEPVLPSGAAPEASGYELEGRPEPPPIPNGWYAACSSDDLGPGAVRSFVAVGRELVAFRDASGAAHVLDAHCVHMGAHLGGGQVRDDTLQCPYHGWRYDGAGTVVEIPYSKGRIPSRACVRGYEVDERDGFVLFWFHAGGSVPDYLVPDLRVPAGGGWSEPQEFRGELVASLQDMAENNVDYTHFFFVHGRAALDESTSQFDTDGPFSTVVERFDDEDLVFTRRTYGPGIAVVDIPNLSLVVTTTTPIDRRHVRLLWHFYFPPGMEDAHDAIIDGVVGEHGLGADEPIWRDKVFLDRPLLVKGDGPITEFRRWYEQFYDGSRTGADHDARNETT